MVKRLLRQPCLLTGLVMVVGFFSGVPSSLAAKHPPARYVYLQDTGKTIVLPVGEQLVVSLPLVRYDDNYWYVFKNTGDGLKLIAGPDTRRRQGWTPFDNSKQLFYFQKSSPGTAHLVMEQHYWSLPMILKVVDGPAPLPPTRRRPPPPPHATAPTERVVLRGVHFDFDKSNIRPGDAAVLDEDVARFRANPNMAVYVNGYCDAIGSEEYNLKLSDRRADTVVKYLVKGGVSESQLIPHGYGKTDFVATNDTAEGRAQNRRVELLPND